MEEEMPRNLPLFWFRSDYPTSIQRLTEKLGKFTGTFTENYGRARQAFSSPSMKIYSQTKKFSRKLEKTSLPLSIC